MEATPLNNVMDPVSESRMAQETSYSNSVGRDLKVAASQVKDDAQQGNQAAQNTEDLAQMIAEDMNQVARVFNTSLNFTVDKPTGKTIIKVVDKETEETIRQIPPEDMLNLMKKMKNMMGMLLDVEV